jgi:hypothetical protein
MGLRNILYDTKICIIANAYWLTFSIGAIIFVIGLLADPYMGKQYVETMIKIIASNQTTYHYIFKTDFFCKACMLTSKTYDNKSSIYIGNNYPYYCNCITLTCGFDNISYYQTLPFVLLCCGIFLMCVPICVVVCRIICIMTEK